MAWYIRFIPNEVDGIAVNINGEQWLTWHSAEGEQNKILPEKWRDLNKINVYGSAIPRGKNASMRVKWDAQERQVMNFDNDEDHDVERP